jgi:hypothetical protein
MNRRKMVVIAGLAFVVVVERNEIYGELLELHPSDPARATALERCGRDDSVFNVFSAEARAACYRKWLVGDPAPDAPRATLRLPNEVDLASAAGQSFVSPITHDDIRSRQAADFYHPR